RTRLPTSSVITTGHCERSSASCSVRWRGGPLAGVYTAVTLPSAIAIARHGAAHASSTPSSDRASPAARRVPGRARAASPRTERWIGVASGPAYAGTAAASKIAARVVRIARRLHAVVIRSILRAMIESIDQHRRLALAIPCGLDAPARKWLERGARVGELAEA